MPEAAAAVAPLSERDRIFTLDVLRGVAVLGILPMNIQSFAMITAAYMNPTAYGDLTGANLWVWLLCHVFADQKFMTIFSMLFGAGIVLLAGRVEAAGKSAAAVHYRRMACLVLFGLLHAYLLWAGDILYSYGMCGLLMFLFRKRSPRTLLVLGLMFLAVGTGLMFFLGWSVPRWPPGEFEAARVATWSPTPQMIAGELATYRAGWLVQLRPRIGAALEVQTFYFFVWIFWRVTGLMLLGMAMFKLGVFSGTVPERVYRLMIAAAVLAGLPVTAYSTYRDFATGWDFRESFFFAMQYADAAAIVIGFGYVGAIMLACRAPALAAAAHRLAAVGRMAFTNYILQSVICTTIFYGHGLGLFGKVSRVGQLVVVAAVWIVQLLISPLWMRHFNFGPLEWLWRSLTYLQREPFRREISRGTTAGVF